MTSHYYTSNPNTPHQFQTIDYTYHGRTLTFVTDANVFSRDHVDFGSSLLIQNMDIQPTDRVLDLGCGYGVIGICAALAADKGTVVMVDVNERAVELAKLNMSRNGITNATAFISDGIQLVPKDITFDVVVTNPPIRAGKETVFQFYEGAFDRLREGGSLWVVIQKKQGADSTEKKLKQLFSEVTLVEQKKGYRVYRADK